jgi:hypothetical protein
MWHPRSSVICSGSKDNLVKVSERLSLAKDDEDGRRDWWVERIERGGERGVLFTEFWSFFYRSIISFYFLLRRCK